MTASKYHAALSGLRLIQPWLTLAYPCEMVRSTHDILVTIDPLRAEQAVSG